MVEHAAVVTCFLRHRGEVLLVLRADDASTYPGRWAGISGYVEDDDPLATARMEVREETGLGDVEVVREGRPLGVHDEDRNREWTVHPFLLDARSRTLTLSEEAAQAEWVPPTAIRRRETVPGLWDAYERVAPTPETVAADTEHGSAYLSIEGLAALRDAAGTAAVEGGGYDDVVSMAEALLDARPSMAALRNRVNRVMADAASPADVETAAIQEISRAFEADEAAAVEAANLLEGTVLTLSRSGTVLEAVRNGRHPVIVAESRPALEGVDVAESLSAADFDVTLCTDAAMAHVLAERDMAAVLVGADSILPDGRVVNKVGTRAVALAAGHEGIPVYVAAASDKISVDRRPRLESGDPEAVYAGDGSVTALNPTFDVTPADLVARVATERGPLTTDEVGSVAAELRSFESWRERQE